MCSKLNTFNYYKLRTRVCNGSSSSSSFIINKKIIQLIMCAYNENALICGDLVDLKLSESDSVVVITSVSHTEGREFEPRSD
jgi:hypothetical protein